MSGTPCNYGSDIKKRGLPTGYVRSLELLWALVFAVIPNGEKTVEDLLAGTEFGLDSSGKLMMLGKFVEDPEALRQTWANSRMQAELERRLSRLEVKVDANPSAGDFSGLDLGLARFDPIRLSSQNQPLRAPQASLLSGILHSFILTLYKKPGLLTIK